MSICIDYLTENVAFSHPFPHLSDSHSFGVGPTNGPGEQKSRRNTPGHERGLLLVVYVQHTRKSGTTEDASIRINHS